MKKLFAVFIISIFSLSCQHIAKPEKPKDLIEKDVLIDVLVDTYLSNAVRSKSYQEIRDGNIRLEKYIYQKYAIDSLQFSKSNAYYSADMDDYLEILEEVERKLNELKGEEEVVPVEESDSKPDKYKDPEERER